MAISNDKLYSIRTIASNFIMLSYSNAKEYYIKLTGIVHFIVLFKMQTLTKSILGTIPAHTQYTYINKR